MFLYNLKTVLKEGLATLTSRKNYDTIDNFFERDWDNLVILDGSRYEMMKEQNRFDAPVEKMYSNASHTIGFVRKNLQDRDNSDLVYITASPQVARFDLGFHKRIDVWDEHWNDEFGTVMPEKVTEAAERAAEEYPDKRIVVHYMQPHYPFIGEKGKEMNSPMYDSIFRKDFRTVWEKLEAGVLTREEVEEAYRENLSVVLDEVEKLVPTLEGKTAITSDHGNVYGKRIGLVKVYGHGYGWSDPEVARVGWITLESEGRRDVERGEEGSDERKKEEEVKEKLEDLGYL